MQKTTTMQQKLINEFTKNYTEKIFYFCIKKTGNLHQAEDLTQDIAFHIISALNKGTIPSSFSAWVWQIARNRYSVWAKQKHIQNESVTGFDIEDYEIEDESKNVLDKLIDKKQIALLRRELAFIKSDYRDIIVAYYIENVSVRNIAEKLSLSPNAVQQRLHRARIVLKEGMNMTREFGTRSYNPENITFAASGGKPTGLPWKAVHRKIPNNILLQASNNPSTLEELSMELGIALPYIEEEVEILHQSTLLEKLGDKYITNFLILDRDCQLDIYHELKRTSKERNNLLKDLLISSTNELRKLLLSCSQVDDNTLRWLFTTQLIDGFIMAVAINQRGNTNPPIRANGEYWGFMGFETVDLPERLSISHDSMGPLCAYSYCEYSINNHNKLPTSAEITFMCDCIRNKRLIFTFTDYEKKIWNNINGRYAHANENGEVIFDIVVYGDKNHEEYKEFIIGENNIAASFKLLAENITQSYVKVMEMLEKHTDSILQHDFAYYAYFQMSIIRTMAIHDLVEDGTLQLPENPDTSTIGVYIQV